MSNVPPASDPFSVPPSPQVQPRSSSSATIWIILGVVGVMMLFCGGILVALLLPAIGAARQAAQRMQRSNNAKQVALAIHNYHSAYKQLPFTTNTNMAGEETIGWRIAVSPFTEGQRQWEMIDSTQPWDSPTNLAISTDPPMAFQAMKGNPGETGVFAIVSEESMFPPTADTKVRFRDVLDGLSNTVMMIELPNRTAVWSSTQDMTPDEAFAAISELDGAEAGHLIMADGSVRAVTNSLDRTTFDALVTREGSETIGPNF
ncbi:hypothetical protein CA13_35120 [Planctomycetes bacterium CA13]|uniref:DUF1559 domain-containing protein n=1 Tax=Novipirellula herctigrandis TaxID=2527986 RepID=A0A5C5Z4U8_9BACT|nr:hypothetical protein CA13_35120 [Planctomycetes bacterium CA13]